MVWACRVPARAPSDKVDFPPDFRDMYDMFTSGVYFLAAAGCIAGALIIILADHFGWPKWLAEGKNEKVARPAA